MNTRNIDALRTMIDVLGYGWPDERAKMAHDLAAAGALAPNALTEGESERLLVALSNAEGAGSNLRHSALCEIERIAKGET